MGGPKWNFSDRRRDVGQSPGSPVSLERQELGEEASMHQGRGSYNTLVAGKDQVATVREVPFQQGFQVTFPHEGLVGQKDERRVVLGRKSLDSPAQGRGESFLPAWVHHDRGTGGFSLIPVTPLEGPDHDPHRVADLGRGGDGTGQQALAAMPEQELGESHAPALAGGQYNAGDPHSRSVKRRRLARSTTGAKVSVWGRMTLMPAVVGR